ncbi:glycosyltransferase family 4 protein [Agrobacterium larrymoorei]|uniref:Glycosyltransferase family 4 protein n=1 Tax=Agrobacterium larrymoorei TaxID=160699 RepID=A0A4D7DSU5_9HYPH|nr:glycosyltransferase family 4 protein [Agrobacterium larrymoorei]QCI97342.1 glycosyltransferase family 4 protein [Agrobacterium larrymoorei]QYA07224.1 hypothetical protein J5285_00365 [Agrobacterium larrymoorei]
MTSSKVHFWPHTKKTSVASHRIRCQNVMRGLQKIGISTAYYQSLLHRRFNSFFLNRPPKILVLSKRTKLSSLEWAIKLKQEHNTKLILDICDNIFFNSTDERNVNYRKTVAALNMFDLVVTPSNFLANAIAHHLHPQMRVEVVLDAVEQSIPYGKLDHVFRRKPISELEGLRANIQASGVELGRRLVWFGHHGTTKAQNGMFDLEHFANIFEQHHAEKPISLTIISNNKERYLQIFEKHRFTTQYLEWNLGTVDHALQMHDIALIPVRQNNYNLSKSANRVTTSLANGLAVCASAIDSYEPFRSCITLDDWEDGLRKLMASPQKRQRCVDEGMRLVEQHYTQAAVSRRWQQLLQDL